MSKFFPPFDISRLLLYDTQYMMHKFLAWIRFNRMYFGRPPWDTGISPPELLAFLEEHPPGRALDLGCGTGTNLVTIAKAGWQVSGVDFVPKAVAQARARLRDCGLPGAVRVGDVARREVVQDGAPFDLVLDIGCYHGISAAGRAAYRQNLLAILAPGGSFLLYAHVTNPGSVSRVGILEQDIIAMQSILRLETREDSLDQWGRSAVWLHLRKTPR